MIPKWLHKHPTEWPPNARAMWDERAAICEHHGGATREVAEERAAALVRKWIVNRGER